MRRVRPPPVVPPSSYTSHTKRLLSRKPRVGRKRSGQTQRPKWPAIPTSSVCSGPQWRGAARRGPRKIPALHCPPGPGTDGAGSSPVHTPSRSPHRPPAAPGAWCSRLPEIPAARLQSGTGTQRVPTGRTCSDRPPA